MILVKGVLFLPIDTWDHIDAIARSMERQQQCQVTRSDAVRWLALQHWKKTNINKAKKRAEKPSIVIPG